MLCASIGVGNGAGASGQLFGDAGHFLFGNVAVVTIECLTSDSPGISEQKKFDTLCHVSGMHLLSTLRRTDGLSSKHLTDQVKPSARACGVSQSVDTCRTQGTDRPAMTQTKAMHEFFKGSLVCPVLAGRPQRVSLIEWSVFEDHLVDSAGRNEHEARHICLECGLEELKRAREIDTHENFGSPVAAPPSIPRTFPLHGRVDDSVRLPYQLAGGSPIT